MIKHAQLGSTAHNQVFRQVFCFIPFLPIQLHIYTLAYVKSLKHAGGQSFQINLIRSDGVLQIG